MNGYLKHPFDASRDIFRGPSDATVRLVWYLDFTSDRTRRVRDIMRRSADRFTSQNVSFSYRFLPAVGNENGSEIAARAAIAAAEQGRFDDMRRALFSRPANYTLGVIMTIAEILDLDQDRLREVMFSEETTRHLEEDRASAIASGGHGTPLLFIDNRQYLGAWDEHAITEAIEKPIGLRIRLASEDFFHWAASAGMVLVVSTIAALIIANIGWHETYEHLRHTKLGLTFGEMKFAMPLEAWINDALMAFFFLVVGIEIKREMVDGELSDMSRAALPILGAIGGMLVPAVIYAAINWGQDTAHGWGIPMATDIAFTLGIMALLGKRVPTSLKIFVSALAIADDLGAILVIAAFYGHGFHLDAFLWAVGIFAIMLLLNRGRVYARMPYLLLGILLWVFVHESGLHATLAGVLTALAIPSRRAANIEGVAEQAAAIFEAELRDPHKPVGPVSLNRLQGTIDRLREPGFHLQHALESWSNFMILPLFAFFNTGILLIGSTFSPFAPEALGIMAGLLIGKPVGIFLICYIGVRLGFAKLSPEISWTQIIGAGLLAGVGFTMSIFIGSAAFEGAQLESVKLAILLASTLAATLGALVLISAARNDPAPVSAEVQAAE
jgi:NhaA family Na+:H+ antiporter